MRMDNGMRKYNAIITRIQRELNGRLEQYAHEAFGEPYRDVMRRLVIRHMNKPVGDAASHVMRVMAFRTMEKQSM